MKRIFLDTNVIIDFFADRVPFAEAAAILFEMGNRNLVELCVAAISYNNTYYIFRKVSSHEKAMELMKELDLRTVVQETSATILRSAINSTFHDFEDAIQFYSASEMGGVEMIVTRNVADFKESSIPVYNPAEAVNMLAKAI